MSNVIGLDLSLTETGVAIINSNKLDPTLIEIKSKPTAIKTPINELKRILGIKNSIMDVVKGSEIDIAVIEGLAFMAKNTTSLIQLSGLNYMIREALYNLSIKFVIVAPTQLKKYITGKGNSPKDTMMLETYKRYGQSFTSNNLCDAFGLATIGVNLLHQDKKITIPQKETIKLLTPQL